MTSKECFFVPIDFHLQFDPRATDPQLTVVLPVTHADSLAGRFHLGRDCAALSCGAIPAVSEWGLVVLALILLTGAKIAFALRPQEIDRLQA